MCDIGGCTIEDHLLDIPELLRNERFDDRYFDVLNALDEARHIHINGSDFIGRLRDGFSIGETGFGAGRMLVAVMEALEASGIAGVGIHYVSVDLYPISAARMANILGDFRFRAGRHIDKMIGVYSGFDVLIPGWHHGFINMDRDVAINLHLYVGEALEMVNAMGGGILGGVPDLCDAWFLDGHAPAKNPDIWRAELMAAIARRTVSGGTVTTYTVASAVRRNLTAAGFKVEKVPGHGRKREALRGVFLGKH